MKAVTPGVGGIEQEDAELVVAQAGHDVVVAACAVYGPRDVAQHFVAGANAVLLVDGGEVVDVDQHDGDNGGPCGGSGRTRRRAGARSD